MDARDTEKLWPIFVWCYLVPGCTLVGEAVLSDKPESTLSAGSGVEGTSGSGGSATSGSTEATGGDGASSASGMGGGSLVPMALTLDCPSQAVPGAVVSCVLSLSANDGSGVAGEASQLTCVATPGPVTLFADDFDDGALDPPWTALQGSPKTSSLQGNDAAFADQSNWEAAVTLAVTGLSQLCVDFAVAQSKANSNERIRWEVAFDGGASISLFDLDFKAWKTAGALLGYNRNACAVVPAGSATATLRLLMDSDDRAIWVDNVRVTGVGAPYVNLAQDSFSNVQAWTIAGGSPPFAATFSGSSALLAKTQSFTATSALLDVATCDVVDTDLSFGFDGKPDPGDAILLEISHDGGSFLPLESLDLGGAWDAQDSMLTWLALRRTIMAGASTLQYRFSLSSDDVSDGVAVDDFQVGCATLPKPLLAPLVDSLDGDYQLSITSAIPASLDVLCTWSGANAASLVAEHVLVYAPL